MPTAFQQANQFGVRGGVESGFMSTTTDRSVATSYASHGTVGIVIEMQMGMVDRGADLSWCSQYAHEQEILFQPLTGLEVHEQRVEGSVLVMAMRLSINLTSETIERVTSQRKSLVERTLLQMRRELHDVLHRRAPGILTHVPEAVLFKTIDRTRDEMTSKPADFFNKDQSLSDAFASTLQAKTRTVKEAEQLLLWAVRNGDADLVEWCLVTNRQSKGQHFFDESLTDGEQTLYQIAVKCGFDKCAKLLRGDQTPRQGTNALKQLGKILGVSHMQIPHQERWDLRDKIQSGEDIDVILAALSEEKVKGGKLQDILIDRTLWVISPQSGHLQVGKDSSRMTEWDVELLCKLIAAYRLRLLETSGLRVENCKRLADAIRSSTELMEVNLDGFALPIKKLKGTEPVDSLDFSDKRLGVASAVVIASLISENASLTKCKLSGNQLGVDGWTYIFNGLRDSPTSKITEWDLSSERLGPTIATPLAEYLTVTAELTSLDVRYNSINGNGASQLSVAVLGNLKIETFNEIPIKEMRTDSLTELDLKDKGIEVVGGMVLAGLLPVMASLTELNLSGNKINAEGAQPLADALRVNASLTPDVSASAS